MKTKFVSNAERKREWMLRFENIVSVISPAHAGKIDWNTAMHFFNTGLTLSDAAKRLVDNVAPVNHR